MQKEADASDQDEGGQDLRSGQRFRSKRKPRSVRRVPARPAPAADDELTIAAGVPACRPRRRVRFEVEPTRARLGGDMPVVTGSIVTGDASWPKDGVGGDQEALWKRPPLRQRCPTCQAPSDHPSIRKEMWLYDTLECCLWTLQGSYLVQWPSAASFSFRNWAAPFGR